MLATRDIRQLTFLLATKDDQKGTQIRTTNKEKIKESVSLVVSRVGRGIAVMFADNPNFRGAWYGTNRLFLNAIFFGDKISIP